MPKHRDSGNYQKSISNVMDIDFGDWMNPWNFYKLMTSDDAVVYQWLRNNNLLVSELTCLACGADCTLRVRSAALDGFAWRCDSNRDHEYSVRKFSYFERRHYNIRDICQFLYSFLQGKTLLMCAREGGIDYKKSAGDWINFARDLFKAYVTDTMFHMKFSGTVEIDESIFGHKVKYHRGNPNRTASMGFGILRESF